MLTLFYISIQLVKFCIIITIMMTKKEIVEKKNLAYRLFMNGRSQKEIAGELGTSPNTLSKWATKGNWQERLHDEKTSSVELANAMMLAAKKMTEIIIREISNGDYSIDTITKCSDNVVKIMASAERIANTINKATVIDVLTSLDMWLLQHSKTDPDLTPELLSTINHYHNEYIKYIKGRE